MRASSIKMRVLVRDRSRPLNESFESARGSGGPETALGAQTLTSAQPGPILPRAMLVQVSMHDVIVIWVLIAVTAFLLWLTIVR
jgi:hypothetical protein